MGQRHAFWVIVTGTTPTSFRSRYRDDLLPTLTQLRRTAPDAVLQWFDRGRLWESPDAARDALKAQQRGGGPPRGRDWRPGGSHADPRARFALTRDQKRARFKKRRDWKPREEPSGGGDFFGDARGPKPDRPGTPRPSDRPRGTKPRSSWGKRPHSGPRLDDGQGRGEQPRGAGHRRPWQGDHRAGPKPGGRPAWKGKPSGDRPAWKGKPWGDRPPWKGKPSGARPDWKGKPSGDRPPWKGKPSGDRPAWKGKPPGGRPAWKGRPPAGRPGRPPGGARRGGKPPGKKRS